MSKFVFDYNKFLAYYKNQSNFMIDDMNPRPIVYFFRDNPYPNQTYQQVPEPKQLPKEYIVINNKRVYISFMPGNRLLFSIPKEMHGYLWDDHYHFGLRNFEKRGTRGIEVPVTFFHKTTQNVEKRGKEQDRCYIQNQIEVSNVDDVRCFEKSIESYMKNQFKDPEELSIIAQIIQRPFAHEMYGGTTKIRILGRVRNIVKVGRKRMIMYKHKLIPLSEAKKIERHLRDMGSR